MQGRQAFDPKAKTAIDLDSFVADDHLLRRVDRVLGLSFVRELTAVCYADGRGRPSIDPEVYFRMLLVAYLYGITSDRRLCEEVRYNLAYRWFCRLSLEGDVPDHSSLRRIQGRYGEAIFLAVFRQIVTLCQQKGLVKSVAMSSRRRNGTVRSTDVTDLSNLSSTGSDSREPALQYLPLSLTQGVIPQIAVMGP